MLKLSQYHKEAATGTLDVLGYMGESRRLAAALRSIGNRFYDYFEYSWEIQKVGTTHKVCFDAWSSCGAFSDRQWQFSLEWPFDLETKTIFYPHMWVKTCYIQVTDSCGIWHDYEIDLDIDYMQPVVAYVFDGMLRSIGRYWLGRELMEADPEIAFEIMSNDVVEPWQYSFYECHQAGLNAVSKELDKAIWDYLQWTDESGLVNSVMWNENINAFKWTEILPDHMLKKHFGHALAYAKRGKCEYLAHIIDGHFQIDVYHDGYTETSWDTYSQLSGNDDLFTISPVGRAAYPARLMPKNIYSQSAIEEWLVNNHIGVWVLNGLDCELKA